MAPAPDGGAVTTAVGADKRQRIVLLVEDETIVSLYLEDLLTDLNYQILGPAADAAQAEALAAQQQPDIAIVDVSLKGGKDGVQLAAELRALYGTSIIFLSGYDHVAGREDVRRVAPAAILQKPCRPDAIEYALRQAESVSRPSTS